MGLFPGKRRPGPLVSPASGPLTPLYLPHRTISNCEKRPGSGNLGFSGQKEQAGHTPALETLLRVQRSSCQYHHSEGKPPTDRVDLHGKPIINQPRGDLHPFLSWSVVFCFSVFVFFLHLPGAPVTPQLIF